MLTILLIEHHDDSRIVTERLLSRNGFAVRAVPDVPSALAPGAPPHVLISDMVPHGTVAEETAAALRARFLGVPVILLTCLPESCAGATAARLGPCEVLMKPFGLKDLCAAIARACGPETNRLPQVS